jgi:two-component system chemotaxis response regulator CheY
MRILIVEDDSASRTFLFKYLSRFAECDITIDGIEAIEAYILSLEEGNPYDLILLDIMMPKLDGVSALEKIRGIEIQNSIPPKDRVKVIITTALSETQSVSRLPQNYYDSFIMKPFNTQTINEVIGSLGFSLEKKE